MRSPLLLVAALLVLLAPAPGAALTVQQAILHVKPAVALVTAQVDAEITMSCGQGLTTVKPKPFVETGTGWFIDGRGYLITNAHVVDPAHRVPAWVTHELKKKAVDQACVEPALRARGIMPGQRPDVEEQLRREAGRALDTAKVVTTPQITVLLSNGLSLRAEVTKFSPPISFDVAGRPARDSGRDLALLKVKDGDYPAIDLSTRDAKIGDPVHILGFPGVVLSHELLNQSVTIEASVTNGAVSGFKVDQIGQDLIQTDAPAAHGNSGGPAVGSDARLVGVLQAVTLSPQGGAIVQGFNFLIPARDVERFLQGTGVSAGRSRFNDVWFAGLEAYFAERWAVAAQRFAEANRLQPNLVDVKRALAEAEENVKNPPPRPFPWAWATLGVTLVSAGAYGIQLARRWKRNRHRILPAQVIGVMESGGNPLLLDVRTRTDYETSPLRLPGAVRLEPEALEGGGPTELNIEPGQMIIAYCTSPEEATSARVARRLRERGYRNVRILKGGLGGWTNARLPVESKTHLPSIGVEIYKNLTLGDVERRRFKAGDLIFREGADSGGEAYVVHSGTVEIRRTFDGEHRLLGTLGEGELFGEMALFRHGPRSADAVAHTDVELLVIKNERLDWLIRNRPQLTTEILRRLSNWIVQTDRERALANR
ncbi:MAG TPA: cyclic nucleotide-binding domain-containing protein [Candidatus Tectomicrobia bacterium]|nr:cyclic nucleotide-binding domain-containing protein [Candidatus Tectomicrobia bacterium]